MNLYISSFWSHGKSLNLYYLISLAGRLGHVTEFWLKYVHESKTRPFWIHCFYFHYSQGFLHLLGCLWKPPVSYDLATNV